MKIIIKKKRKTEKKVRAVQYSSSDMDVHCFHWGRGERPEPGGGGSNQELSLLLGSAGACLQSGYCSCCTLTLRPQAPLHTCVLSMQFLSDCQYCSTRGQESTVLRVWDLKAVPVFASLPFWGRRMARGMDYFGSWWWRQLARDGRRTSWSKWLFFFWGGLTRFGGKGAPLSLKTTA